MPCVTTVKCVHRFIARHFHPALISKHQRFYHVQTLVEKIYIRQKSGSYISSVRKSRKFCGGKGSHCQKVFRGIALFVQARNHSGYGRDRAGVGVLVGEHGNAVFYAYRLRALAASQEVVAVLHSGYGKRVGNKAYSVLAFEAVEDFEQGIGDVAVVCDDFAYQPVVRKRRFEKPQVFFGRRVAA